jgi:hypothetical protein
MVTGLSQVVEISRSVISPMFDDADLGETFERNFFDNL